MWIKDYLNSCDSVQAFVRCELPDNKIYKNPSKIFNILIKDCTK